MSLSAPTFPNERQNSLYIDVFSNPQLTYTSGDRVEGNVRVAPSARPANVCILFKGLSIIHDRYDRSTKPEYFEYSRELFQATVTGENFEILRRGTADDGKVEFPFVFTFPHNVRLAPPSNRSWYYSKDSYNHPRFQHSPGSALPPMCKPPTSSRPNIIYFLEARMTSTITHNPQTVVRKELTFTPRPPDHPPALLQPDVNFRVNLPKKYQRHKLIRTRKLLPGYSESGKLGRIKDSLVEKELFFGLNSYSEIPFARFNVSAIPARILVMGAQLPVMVTVEHLERSRSLPNPPDLFIRRLRIQIHSAFHTFVPSVTTVQHGTTKETVDMAKESITIFDQKFESGNGEPLLHGMKLSDVRDIRVLHAKLLPSFTTYGLALEHELQVDIWGECGTHDFMVFACQEQVQIVSALSALSEDEVEQINIRLLEEESGPVYQELDPMTSLQGGASSRTDDFYAEGAVQEIGRSSPAYASSSRPMEQHLRPGIVPPPPYAV